MNRLFNCLLFVLFPVSAICNTGDSIHPDRMQLGVIYSPDYCYRTLKTTGESKWMAIMRDTMEIPKFGYTTGLNFIYKISTRWSAETEVLFSDKGFQTKKYAPEGRVISSTPSAKQPLKIAYLNHYYYLDVPIKLNYYIYLGKINFFLSAGVSVNTFLNQTVTTLTTYTDGSTDMNIKKTTRPSSFEKINFALTGGLGMNYNLTEKYTLKIEPVYKHSITSIINAPVKSYLYTAGMNVGISCHF